jgi:hypothetical protein
MRRYFLVMGALVLMLSLIAACGDDDDSGDEDTDLADDITVTVPDSDGEATESDDSDMTATTDDGEATGTEADAGMTGTESDGAAGTMDADVTGTEDDDDADVTGTEEDDADDGTETDDDAATGTEDDDMDDATGTEDDADDATGTEDDDVAEGTADDADDDGGFGEPITVGDFVLTVNDVMVLDSGGVVAPDEGNQFLGVEMTIENTGTEPVGLSRALLQTHLEDDDGEEYDIDLTATAVAIFSGGFDAQAEIDPGAEITGVAGFQVPEDLSPEDLTLVIEPDGAERIEILLADDDTE